jgi:HK97 gp10 family phage protein
MSDTDELDAYLDGLPDRIRAELSGVVHEQAVMLSDAQRAALQGLEQEPAETGNLEASCTVVPGADDLEWVVQAGGELTTKEVREGSGVAYDYAEAFEFGSSRQHARPFFWPTYREKREQIKQAIAAGVEKVLK